MIYLIRHTRPAVDAGVCYRQAYVPLAESFFEELSQFEENLINPIQAVFMSSLLQCCLQLATSLFEESQIVVDDRLQELCFGDWELQAWDELDPVVVAHWGNHFVHTSSPNGESLEPMSQRAMDLWNSLDHLNQDYIIFTHSGVIQVIQAHLPGSPLDKALTYEVQYGDLVKVPFMDGENCTISFNRYVALRAA